MEIDKDQSENISENLALPIVIILYPTVDSEEYKATKINIPFEFFKNMEGSSSLLSVISNELNIPISLTNYYIKVNHLDGYMPVYDMKTLYFYLLTNLDLDEESRILIKPKNEEKAKNKFEDMEMITLNQVARKPAPPSTDIICSICKHNSKDIYFNSRLGSIYGPYKYLGKNYYVHLLCALWMPNVNLNEKNQLVKVGEEIKRSSKIRCKICKGNNAAIGCCFKDCINNYHYHCMIDDKANKYRFHKSLYLILCPIHYEHEEVFKQYEEEYAKRNGNLPGNDNSKELQAKKLDVEESKYVCTICGFDSQQNKFVICSGCKKAFHMECVGFIEKNKNPIIIGDENENEDFYCRECENKKGDKNK